MSADIDIDLANRDQLLALIQATPARQTYQEQVRRHNSGVYVTGIPYDPVKACAAIDYETAEQLGYFKIDLLNMSVYQLIRDQAHYDQMLAVEPPWSRLWKDPDWAKQLVHIGNYTELLETMRPDSIPRMAAFISIIRPGKAHLQGRPWDHSVCFSVGRRRQSRICVQTCTCRWVRSLGSPAHESAQSSPPNQGNAFALAFSC
jgi:hypothetical protein